MKLPLLSGKEVVRALQRMQFIEISRRGSHIKMKHSDGRIIVFPFHDEVDRYTLRGALRDAEIEVEDFMKAVK